MNLMKSTEGVASDLPRPHVETTLTKKRNMPIIANNNMMNEEKANASIPNEATNMERKENTWEIANFVIAISENTLDIAENGLDVAAIGLAIADNMTP